jgi:uncharacterized SAM-binding protein YcdF (DUF218 family)
MSILTVLALPSGFALFLWLFGLLALLLRRRGLSLGLMAASGLVVAVCSTGLMATALMSPLEYAYPRVRTDQHPEARHIVVLTAWASEDPALSLTDRLNASSAYRVLLALELSRERPDCDVIVSGSKTTAHVMAQALEKLGVPKARLRIEDQGDSTADSAALLGPFVGDSPFFLVTSAGHMPRSFAAMKRERLQPIAAPTEHQEPEAWHRAQWRPTAASLAVSDLAVHEYFARIWERMRGPRNPARTPPAAAASE